MVESTDSNVFDDCDSVKMLLGVFAGATSMCWESIEKAGIFDSTRASDLVDQAYNRLQELVSSED